MCSSSHLTGAFASFRYVCGFDAPYSQPVREVKIGYKYKIERHTKNELGWIETKIWTRIVQSGSVCSGIMKTISSTIQNLWVVIVEFVAARWYRWIENIYLHVYSRAMRTRVHMCALAYSTRKSREKLIQFIWWIISIFAVHSNWLNIVYLCKWKRHTGCFGSLIEIAIIPQAQSPNKWNTYMYCVYELERSEWKWACGVVEETWIEE